MLRHAAYSCSKRLYTTSTAVTPTKKLIYTSPNAILVKFAKVFSLTTLGISSVSTPAVMYYWQSPALQAADLNGAMIIGALIASACSTGALHYLLSPYIGKIYLHETKQEQPISPNTVVTLETLNFSARTRLTTLALRDLVPRPGTFSTWEVSKKAMSKNRGPTRPEILQTRFWLDRRGLGDREKVSDMMRVIQEQDHRSRLI